MRNNPYDDIFKNLAKMMEDLLRNLPNQGTSQFVGYTIITEPGQPPRVLRRDRDGNKHEIPYELIETKDRIFVTAEIAADRKEAPYAQIGSKTVRIHQGEEETEIDLGCDIDIDHSFYNVHHGVMDIVCYKASG
ncbi:MAG: hypothetical protein EHJ95_02280 [Methanobacteriota archaeon]|nr:MAG: hypothetical protein EHJ95_02280 [Euryarchaeota archaeon]